MSVLEAAAVVVLFAVFVSIALSSFSAATIQRPDLDAVFVYWPQMYRALDQGTPYVPYAEVLTCWYRDQQISIGVSPYGLTWCIGDLCCR